MRDLPDRNEQAILDALRVGLIQTRNHPAAAHLSPVGRACAVLIGRAIMECPVLVRHELLTNICGTVLGMGITAPELHQAVDRALEMMKGTQEIARVLNGGVPKIAKG